LPHDDPRGACHWPRAIAREPRLYSVEPIRAPTMKQHTLLRARLRGGGSILLAALQP
jgi:hypothetical protein